MMLVCSCRQAYVRGNFVCGAPASTLVVKSPVGQTLKVIDTVQLSKDASFRFRVPVKRGEPEFFYLYKDSVKLSSLVLKAGDRVRIECDTLGSWTVSGSEDCEMLRSNEMELAAVMAGGELTYRQYMDYYRKMVRFVLSNAHSMAVVPVLYSKLWDMPLFSRPSDAVLLSNVADSLSESYPNSRYVRQLRQDAKKGLDKLYLNNMLQNAEVKDFPELEFPDVNGSVRKLSDCTSAGRTLLGFWDCTDAASAAYNLDVLLPYYRKNRVNIYQVNLGLDKNAWAAMMKAQNLPWTNVCDIRSSSLSAYGVDALPCIFEIDGASVERLSTDALRR